MQLGECHNELSRLHSVSKLTAHDFTTENFRVGNSSQGIPFWLCHDVLDSTRISISAVTSIQKQKARSCSKNALSPRPCTNPASIAAPTPTVIHRNCSRCSNNA